MLKYKKEDFYFGRIQRFIIDFGDTEALKAR